MNQENPKWLQYAVLIQSQLYEMFQDDAENFINVKEFEDEENFKAFLHALSSVVPAQMFNKLTNDEKNYLEFNHIANQLVFEYSTNQPQTPLT